MTDPFADDLAAARQLLSQHQYAPAAAILDRICDAFPDHQAALLESANVRSMMYDYDGVAARFAQLESAGNLQAQSRLGMARISRWLRRPQWADRFYSGAMEQASAAVCGTYALYLERSNDLDRAIEVAERGLEMEPRQSDCLLAKAKVLGRRKAWGAGESTLRVLVADANTPVSARLSGWYELSHLLDGMGDCAGAISAVGQAKTLAMSRPEYAFFQQQALPSERNFVRLLTSLNPNYFKKANEWVPSQRTPIALLGGHPRSGTTLLEHVLDSHSDIVSTDETWVFLQKVWTEFLDETTGPSVTDASLLISSSRLEQWRAGYFKTMESVLDQSLDGKLLVDKNPSLTDAIPVLARVFPECSYIIALRDPRDVVLSCFFMDMPLNEVSVRFQTLKDTAMRYCNAMAMWLVCRNLLSPEKWIEVRYESLVNNLPAQADAVMKKLNLACQPAQLQPHIRATQRPAASPTYADVTRPVHNQAVGKWKRYERWFGEALPILEPMVKRLAIDAVAESAAVEISRGRSYPCPRGIFTGVCFVGFAICVGDGCCFFLLTTQSGMGVDPAPRFHLGDGAVGD